MTLLARLMSRPAMTMIMTLSRMILRTTTKMKMTILTRMVTRTSWFSVTA